MSEAIEIKEIQTEIPGVLLRTRSEADDLVHFEAFDASRDQIEKFHSTARDLIRSPEESRLSRLSTTMANTSMFGLHANGVYAGCFSLAPASNAEVEIGYWIHTRHTNRGLATAGIRALSQFALQTYDRIYGHVSPLNTHSCRALISAGFTLAAEGPRWQVYRRCSQWAEPINFYDPRNERANY